MLYSYADVSLFCRSWQHTDTQRAALLSSGAAASTSGPHDAARRRAPASASLPPSDADNPFRPNPSRGAFMGDSREAYALREHSFAQQTHDRLDEMLAQGRAALDDLVDQRSMLKGTQRRLLDAANTLGLSRDVIGWIERRRCVHVYCHLQKLSL